MVEIHAYGQSSESLSADVVSEVLYMVLSNDRVRTILT